MAFLRDVHFPLHYIPMRHVTARPPLRYCVTTIDGISDRHPVGVKNMTRIWWILMKSDEVSTHNKRNKMVYLSKVVVSCLISVGDFYTIWVFNIFHFHRKTISICNSYEFYMRKNSIQSHFGVNSFTITKAKVSFRLHARFLLLFHSSRSRFLCNAENNSALLEQFISF